MRSPEASVTSTLPCNSPPRAILIPSFRYRCFWERTPVIHLNVNLHFSVYFSRIQHKALSDRCGPRKQTLREILGLDQLPASWRHGPHHSSSTTHWQGLESTSVEQNLQPVGNWGTGMITSGGDVWTRKIPQAFERFQESWNYKIRWLYWRSKDEGY